MSNNFTILYHGTGARRVYSIQKNGLGPRAADFLYASTNPLIAMCFAKLRAEKEDDWGLLLSFEKKGEWHVDDKFMESFKSKQTISASELRFAMLRPEAESQLSDFLINLCYKYKMRIEV